MDLCSKIIKKPLTFQRITGLTPNEFAQIVLKLNPLFHKKCIKNKKLSGRPYGIGSLENQILCLLLYYRTYTTQFFIGFFFRVDAATVCRTIKRIEPILVQIIKIKKMKKFSSVELEKLIIDCTEQPKNRPKRGQKRYYSGKKKRHTVKTEIVIDGNGKICQISKPRPGSMHDIEVRRKGIPLPKAQIILADSGYQGLQKEYENIKIPIKKRRGKPLDRKSKQKNKLLSQQRILVENKIREMKIFQILAQRYRNSVDSYTVKTKIIAGIVNFKRGF